MKKIIFTLFVLFLLNSCNSEVNENSYRPGGFFTPSLSAYTFGVEGGIVTITVRPYNNTFWDLHSGGIRDMWDTTNRYGLSLREFIGFPLNPAPGEFFDFYGVDLSEWDDIESIRMRHYYFPDREEIIIERRSSWFEATRKMESLYKVTVTIQPNTSGRERVFGFGMGNASVRITQSAR